MSVMASNSMTVSGMTDRVSAVVSHLNELHFDRMQNYVNIGNSENELDLISMPTHLMSNSTTHNFNHLGKINDAFEDYDGNTEDSIDLRSSDSFVQSDHEQVYANYSEIVKHDELEDIDRRPVPPTPSQETDPIRILPSGWKEYKTLGGRTYYFQPESNICQWKPPRNRNSQSASAISQSFLPNHCEPSTSTKQVIAEIPLQNEYDTACCSSDSLNKHIPDGMVSYHSALLKANECDQKGVMSQSVNDNICGSLRHFDSKKGFFNGLSDVPPLPPSLTELNNENHAQCTTLEKLLPFQQMNPIEQSIFNPLSQNRFSKNAIRQGPLEKCRVSDSGIKLKKKEWTSSYAYLYSSHLLFYKDQKSAEKTGKHYPAPTDVCDLRGAILSYVDGEKHKDKKRKHVILLVLINKTEYMFSCAGNESEINGWFHALRQVISLLPSVIQTYPMPSIIDYGGSLNRSSTRTKTLLSQSSKCGSTFGTKSSLHHSVKLKLRNSLSKDCVENTSSNNLEFKNFDSNLSRESIIERLLRFFRSRPTMESLLERGIYKPEPVFGSTLSAICTHEKTLVPKFLSEVTRLIEEKGLDIDGLYRVNGNLSSVQKIRCHIDQEKYEALQTEDDVHVLTGALKLFFRELSEPIFPMIMNKEFMSAIREPNVKQRFKAIDEILLKLPLINRETLKILVLHLEKVSTHSSKNRMQIHNLAIMFGPTLFGTEDRTLRKNSNDRKGRTGKRKSSDKNHESSLTMQVEPNQNLAYKMVIYGQIVEFILNESKRFAIFQSLPPS